MNGEIQNENEIKEISLEMIEKVKQSKEMKEINNLKFVLTKIINGKTYNFDCEAEVDLEDKRIRVWIRNNELKFKAVAYYSKNKGTLRLLFSEEICGKRVSEILVDNETKQKIEDWYNKVITEFEKKIRELMIKKEEEFKQFLQDNNYFKNPVKIYQGCDTGKFYVCGIENEKIREFVNEALNKYLNGIIFDNWIPDYYLPKQSAVFHINDLIKQGKAKKEIDERRETYLIVDADVINKIVNLLKQEIRKKEEEKRKMIEEIKEKIKKEGKVLIKRITGPCIEKLNPWVRSDIECDVDVEETYAFASEEEAKKFVNEVKGVYHKKIVFDKELNAYLVTIAYHTY